MNLKEKQTEIANFFSKEHQNLVRYLHSKISNLSEMEIEDVIGDIMLNIFTKIGGDQIENLAGYIYRSVYHKGIDYLRKRKRLISLSETVSSDSESTMGELLADSHYDIQDELSFRELQEKLYRTLDIMEPKQQAIWIATEIEGYSFRELAIEWKEPIGTLLAQTSRQ